MIDLVALQNSIPLETIINEKVAYNKNRVDHQRAARAAENGKKY